MRNDVKIGLVLSLFAVILAGWFFMRRDDGTATVPVAADDSAAGSNDSASNAAGQNDSSQARRDSSSNRNRGPMTRSPDSNRAERRSSRLADGRNSKDVLPGKSTPQSQNPTPRTDRPVRRTHDSDNEALPRTLDDVLNRSGRHPVGPTNDAAESESKKTAGEDKSNPAETPADKPSSSSLQGTNPVTPSVKGEESKDSSSKPKALTPPARPTHRSSNGKYEVYTVGEGDTLAIIAEAKLGKQKYVDLLLAANPGINPARLTPGTKLVIPLDKVDEAMPSVRKTNTTKKQPAPAPVAKKTRVSESAKPKTQTTGSSGRTYTVQKGDSFWKIAEKELGSGVRWPDIFELNKDVVKGKAENLRPGQVLRIPEKSSKAK